MNYNKIFSPNYLTWFGETFWYVELKKYTTWFSFIFSLWLDLESSWIYLNLELQNRIWHEKEWNPNKKDRVNEK